MWRALVLVALGSAAAHGEPAAVDDTRDDDPAPASLASAHLDRDALDDRPHGRPYDLLRHLPGLALITHAFGGQASQFLLRGLDAGRGEELAVVVDGIPVNLISHAHAHGYADLQFVIPDAIRDVELRLGSYAARDGELATAGVLELRTIDALPRGRTAISFSSGSELDDLSSQYLRRRVRRLLYRMTGIVAPELERGRVLLAAEVGIADGPFANPQRFRRGSVLAKWKHPVAGGELAAVFTFYAGRWAESGLLAASELAAGHLGAFSASDPTQGGTAMRTAASLAWATRDARGDTWRATGYVVDASHRLYTNPTLFLRDADAGDQQETLDRRTTYGADASYRRAHPHGRLRLGVQLRADDVVAEAWHTERQRRLATCAGTLAPCTATAPRIRNLAVYAEDTLALGDRIRVEAGARLDELIWDVDDRDPETAIGSPTLGNTDTRSRISPKLGIVVRPSRELELALRGAGSVHTTDARAAAAGEGFGACTRGWSGELGVRVEPLAQLRATAALWAGWLPEHQQWNTEASAAQLAPSAGRYGVDVAVTGAPLPWLAADASLSIARGRTSRGEPLALAPRTIASAGLAAHGAASAAALRVRALGARATTDPAFTTEGYAVVDLVAARRWGAVELELTIENLLDRGWREAQVASAVRPSRYVEPVDDLLVAPGAPRTAMLAVTCTW
jgi:outer membrane receptor protein involved in Fe transport